MSEATYRHPDLLGCRAALDTREEVAATIASRTEVRLADGRHLIYFDETAGTDRSQPDQRTDLARTRPVSELRYDVLVDEWVVLAGHRQDRTHLPDADACPLCPSTPDRPSEIPSPAYDVVVFENRFPALSGAAEVPLAPGPDPIAGPSWRQAGAGRCEVIAFSDDHDRSFAQLTPGRVGTVLDVWIDRTVELSKLPGIQQVVPFENRGPEIGVTLHHPHGQIYALPFVSPRSSRMIAAASRHRTATGACLWCEMIERELQPGGGAVTATDQWVAFVPWAARWPFEVYLCPRRHTPDLPALDDLQRAEFPAVYLDILNRFDRLFDLEMPYMAVWRQAPVRDGRHVVHLCLHLFSIRRAPDKLKYLAATESGIGVFVNDIPPEQAAGLLRDRAKAQP